MHIGAIMESHGNYKIELIENIVHIYPSGGFNEQGVKQLNDKVLLIAPLETPWALVAHPDDSAGLTPEAVNEIVRFLQQISKMNCVVIGMEVLPTWQGVLESSIKGNVSIPIYMDTNMTTLSPLIKNILDNA